jgi:hypothetical protein
LADSAAPFCFLLPLAGEGMLDFVANQEIFIVRGFRTAMKYQGVISVIE